MKALPLFNSFLSKKNVMKPMIISSEL